MVTKMEAQSKSVAWLLFCHAPNGHDWKKLNVSLKKMQMNLSHGVVVYVVKFGPTVVSKSTLQRYTKKEVTLLGEFRNDGIKDVVPNCKKFVKIVRKSCKHDKVVIKAACFWMHGASFGCGPWKKWDEPFLQITDLVKHILAPFPVKLVLFDACYQGGMSCLYEVSRCVESVKFTLASPAFHPFISLIDTKAFGKLSEKCFTSNKSLKKYAHLLNCQWNDLTKVKWKCLMVFDMRFILSIGELVKEHFHDLCLNRIAQIDKEDTNLLDLYTCATKVPTLQLLIEKCVDSSCGKCTSSVTKNCHGMSIEGKMPRKWVKAYKDTLWFQEIVGSYFEKN